MNHLKEFYKLFSGGDSKYTLACRYQFYLSMNFGNLIFSYDKNLFDLSKVGYLVQAINLPNLQLKASEYGATAIVNTDVGTYAYPGLNSRAIPDLETNMVITFFDTDTPVFEVFFVPWLRAVADYRTIGDVNFPRANVYIELFDNSNQNTMLKYTIKGVYPVFVSTPDLKYDSSTGISKRDVRFSYNDLTIEYIGAGKKSNNMMLEAGKGLVTGTASPDTSLIDADIKKLNNIVEQRKKQLTAGQISNLQYNDAIVPISRRLNDLQRRKSAIKAKPSINTQPGSADRLKPDF